LSAGFLLELLLALPEGAAGDAGLDFLATHVLDGLLFEERVLYRWKLFDQLDHLALFQLWWLLCEKLKHGFAEDGLVELLHRALVFYAYLELGVVQAWGRQVVYRLGLDYHVVVELELYVLASKV